MKSIELFVGAGGLALGVARSGFEHQIVIECNKNAVATLSFNKSAGVEHIRDWNIYSGRIEDFDYGSVDPEITMISGGPPCQPFSLGGKHKAHRDKRDMFPRVTEAVRHLRPSVFFLENVKGLMRKSFEPYFNYIIHRLMYPHYPRKDDESWEEHLVRLKKFDSYSRKPSDTWYNVNYKLLNAADYGVPQKRERVFIVGIRSDLGATFEFPEPTHSEDALIYSKYISGDYWNEVDLPKKKRPEPSIREQRRLDAWDKHDISFKAIHTAPWRTVRQALAGLKQLIEGETDKDDPNHFLNPGARSYPGHTGSSWDEPAKTLKAGDHGVPGGENTVRVNGKADVRYFSVREAARLQTFPDEYHFCGAWTEGMRQLGNAVPVHLANVIAEQITSTIRKSTS
jgi:DNA (cytosine-5)-methyltransferase 1